MSRKSKFKVGDVVCLKNGHSPWKITEYYFSQPHFCFYYFGHYINSNYKRAETSEHKIELHEGPKQCLTCTNKSNEGGFIGDYCSPCHNEMENEMNTLYEVTLSETNTVYAHKLAVNSKNEWVMEPKGGGTIFTVEPSKAQEVLPYTVCVQYGHGASNCEYQFLAEPGEVSVGDYLVGSSTVSNDFVIVKVTAVNTKSKKATKTLEGFKKIA